MTKLQIRDRNNNWHTLIPSQGYVGGRGYVLFYDVEGHNASFEASKIDHLMQDGTVREIKMPTAKAA